jgi:hypothetical protein
MMFVNELIGNYQCIGRIGKSLELTEGSVKITIGDPGRK